MRRTGGRRSRLSRPRSFSKTPRETESLAEAVAECTLVVGTGTLERRKAEQPVVSLPELGPLVTKELRRGGRVALVFGSEKRGLTREELARCHVLAVIPTDERQPSMNLGQAVAVCLYELAARINEPEGSMENAKPQPRRKNKDAPCMGRPVVSEKPGHSQAASVEGDDSKAPATAREFELLAGVVEETMAAANYSPAAMRNANRHDVHLLLRRLRLRGRDAERILGLFRRILWRLKHASK